VAPVARIISAVPKPTPPSTAGGGREARRPAIAAAHHDRVFRNPLKVLDQNLTSTNGEGMKNYRFSVVIEKDKNGYFAFCPELQGCYTQGDTYEEALENAEDAISLHVKDILEAGEELPEVEFVSLTSLEVAV
jgi:predicted RNase H-like HicB family nuclease